VHAFTCTTCGQLVFFHNTVCLRCGSALAFDPEALRMVVVEDDRTRCVNRKLASCNWLAPAPGERCLSCVLTRTRPDDDDAEALTAFADAEAHKRRLVFNLRSLGIALSPRDESTGAGVAFDLLASGDDRRVMTGHAAGVITLDLAESDDAHRARVRALMSEPYRTVLGHFRHEIGHYLFTVLVDDETRDEVRALFGDETVSYQAALDRHYAEGPPDGWEKDHVSAYATMHPAEDFAETFAHYLHIRATLQTAAAYRLRVDGPDIGANADRYAADPVAVDPTTLRGIMDTWLPLSYALNAVSRSLGDGDLYPFILPRTVIAKLDVVHRLVLRGADPSVEERSRPG
jgi:hypothetical protein